MKIYFKQFAILFFLFANFPVSAQNYYNETYRGQLHFSAPRGWINDPSGTIYYNGEYHLFYQHNPYGNVWSTMYWGHAVSTDLVNWKNLPIAFEPDEFGAIWSGSAIIDHNNSSGLMKNGVAPMILFYTANGAKKTQRMAYSYDGRNFTKYPDVILPYFSAGNRDPQVIWHEPTKKWVMALYTNTTRKHIVVFLRRATC